MQPNDTAVSSKSIGGVLSDGGIEQHSSAELFDEADEELNEDLSLSPSVNRKYGRTYGPSKGNLKLNSSTSQFDRNVEKTDKAAT